jgi:D-alanine--D-alanine ligase
MHKAWTKQVAAAHGIAIIPYSQMRKGQKMPQEVTFPVWVKAVHLGSSIGVTRATNSKELQQGIEAAFAVDDEIIIEQEIVGEEIEFAILGSAYPRAALPCRILAEGTFYDYEKKYGANASKVEVPAIISKKKIEEGQELALRSYQTLGCQGIARVDFFLDREGKFWLNEVNPFPGFTVNSGYPKMWEASGLSMAMLVDEMIAIALFKARVS